MTQFPMKQIAGIWLPATDNHFEPFLKNGPMIYGAGTYQFRKYAAVRTHLGDSRRGFAIDIGAHVGMWSRVMQHDFKHLVAFEPLAQHIECFKRNCPNVTLHEVALGSTPGFALMHYEPSNTGSSCIADTGLMTYKVPIRALDEFSLEKPDFIKIDVEGYEFEVLRGAENTIRTYRPDVLIEQKPQYDNKYTRKKASSVLEGWGMKQVFNMGGDLLYAFP